MEYMYKDMANTEMNRSHWDEQSSTYNAKFGNTIQQIIEEIRNRRGWIAGGDLVWVDDEEEEGDGGNREVRVLDYACGTGLVSKALAPYVTQSIGIDLAPGMANEYNQIAHDQGLSPSEMFAVQGNLLDPNNPSPSHLTARQFHNFDIVVVGLGFHHFDDPALAAKRLAERLKKGGVFCIVDFMPHGKEEVKSLLKKEGDGEDVKVMKTVKHFGFSEDVIRGVFEGAGVGGDFAFVVVGKGVVLGYGHEEKQEGKGGQGHVHDHGHGHGHRHGDEITGSSKRTLFMARGVKL